MRCNGDSRVEEPGYLRALGTPEQLASDDTYELEEQVAMPGASGRLEWKKAQTLAKSALDVETLRAAKQLHGLRELCDELNAKPLGIALVRDTDEQGSLRLRKVRREFTLPHQIFDGTKWSHPYGKVSEYDSAGALVFDPTDPE